ncbi:DUF1697 domain-containing protein [Wenyingzhuangia sp. IMCC45533]
MKYIVLLRGINVSGKNKILMKEFCQVLLQDSRFEEVKSYIQSGNFIITSTIASAHNIRKIIEDFIDANYHYKITAFCYKVDEFKAILDQHPYEILDKKNYVTFTLSKQKQLNQLELSNFGNDLFSVNNSIIHIRYHTQYSDSKLNNSYIEKTTQTTATTRNWNTLQKLILIAT